MPSVEVKKKQIFVGKKKIPLISGEVHYWRLNPSTWSACLNEVRRMGLTVVATYVPWYLHEYERGKFDFTGKHDPCCNLKGFLELCKKKHFWVIIRPGPYIYSESPNDGVPDYAYKYHRLHPKFLKYASDYMKKVCQIIRPYQASRRGGHIIALQADNEIDPWPDVFGHQYGFGDTPGIFQDFMQEKYHGDINLLNDAWGSQYTSFRETGPYIVHNIKGDKGLRRHIDYYEFKHYYALQVAKWCVEAYRKLNITVPIYVNLYPFFYAHDWAPMESVSDFSGIDLYPENEFAVEKIGHRKFMDKIRYTRTYSKIPYIAEFASGVWHNRHYETGVLSPTHYRLICLSALAAGVCGWNWYMLVNRDNWYMSPINEWGRPRPELTSVFKDMVTTFNKIKPYDCKRETDIAVTFNPIQYAAKTIPKNNTLLHSLYEADIDYDFCDPHRGITDKKVLFYSGNQWLSRKGHENLYRYVKNGGVLIAFRNYPRRDDMFHDMNLLGFVDPTRVLFEFKKECMVTIAQSYKEKALSSVYAFARVPGRKIYATVKDRGQYIVGYEKKIGKGSIIHIGIEPNSKLLFTLLRYLNVSLQTYSKTSFVKSTLLRQGKKYHLIIINNGTEDKTATICITHPQFLKKRFAVRNIEGRAKEIKSPSPKPTITVDVPRKNGAVLELSLTR